MSLLGLDVASYEDMKHLNKKYSINLFQISAKYINKENIISTHNEQSISKSKFTTVVHYSYSINLAHTWTINDWWIQQLIEEIRSAHSIGAFGIVIHTGKSLSYSKSTAINNMFSALLYVHEQTVNISNIKILIETPAGQGTELLKEINDFIKFMLKFEKKESLRNRFGICIDTCHIYAAGYNISQKEIIESYFNLIHEKIGLDKIKLIHLNNSRGELGSNIDRHANLDSGTINLDSIKNIVRFINKLEIPMVLETPPGDDYKLILKDYLLLKDYTNK